MDTKGSLDELVFEDFLAFVVPTTLPTTMTTAIKIDSNAVMTIVFFRQTLSGTIRGTDLLTVSSSEPLVASGDLSS